MKALRNWTWKNLRLESQVEEALGLEFELDLFGALLEQAPDDVELLLQVGNLHTRLGQYQESLAIDQRLVKLRPDEPIFHYNLACSLALLDAVEPAFGALEAAVRLGYNDLEHLQRDDHLRNLRRDPRFAGVLKLLIQTHRERMGRRSEDEILEQELDFEL